MGKQLHVVFFPFMAQGHMIPTLDMAKLFSARGVKTTIITTPLNAPVFSKSIHRSNQLGLQIGLQIVDFPAAEAGLPEGCERADGVTSDEIVSKFFVAMGLFREPVERVLRDHRPDCLVADMFFPWATEAAEKYGVPRLVFHGTSFFALCAGEALRIHEPFRHVASDSEPFVLPGLPHEIKMTRTELPPFDRYDTDTDFSRLIPLLREAEKTSYGIISNTFYALEPDYADHYRNVIGRTVWHVGPVSLCNRGIEDKAERGKKAAIDEQECLQWLDSKKPKSVLYVCFGSMSKFTDAQLYEIAAGLESSGQQFIWVVRKSKNEEQKEQKWLPHGFEERIQGKGLIVRGWAPQMLILDHEAIGGFVTHCGWNSILEGVCAGVPMVTWPVFAEQFYNEKLVTDVLKIGVQIGAKEWNQGETEGVKREAVEKAVKEIMEGEEMRRRAAALKEAAMEAVEAGGSSYSGLTSLIEELSSRQKINGK